MGVFVPPKVNPFSENPTVWPAIVILHLAMLVMPFYVTLTAQIREFVPAERIGRAITSLYLFGLTSAFLAQWLAVEGEQQLRETLLAHDRFLSLRVDDRDPRTARFVNLSVREIQIPDGCLVAVVRREEETIVPGGGTVLRDGDELTIIGETRALERLKERYQLPD